MALQIGDKIPPFSAVDQHGNLFDSNSVIGHRTAVIYFYPKDFTPGCTKEACQFRDMHQVFKDLAVKVIGISADAVQSHHRFSQKYKLPFTLLSDKNQILRQKFGIKKHGLGLIPGRETLVIDKNGILRFKYRQLRAASHVEKALKAVKQLQDEH